MITAVDTSVLIAIASGESSAGKWADLLADAQEEGDLLICPHNNFNHEIQILIYRRLDVGAGNKSAGSNQSANGITHARHARLQPL